MNSNRNSFHKKLGDGIEKIMNEFDMLTFLNTALVISDYLIYYSIRK